MGDELLDELKRDLKRHVICDRPFCQDDGPGRKVFYGASACLGVASLLFLVFFVVVLAKFDALLDGPIFSFLLLNMFVALFSIAGVLMGICGTMHERRPFLTCDTMILFVVLVYTLFASLFTVILVTNNDLEGTGSYVTDLKLNFEVQVFNNCCGFDADSPFIVVQCDNVTFNNSIASNDNCVDTSLDWSNMVSDALCSELQAKEDETFVGTTSSSSCGGFSHDFEAFRTKLESFINPKVESFMLYIWLLFVVVLFTWVATFLTCLTMPIVVEDLDAEERAENQKLAENQLDKMLSMGSAGTGNLAAGNPNYDKDLRSYNVYEANPGQNKNSNIESFYIEPVRNV